MASTKNTTTPVPTPTLTPDSPIPPARPRSRASLLLHKATSFVSSGGGARSLSPPPFDLAALQVEFGNDSPKVATADDAETALAYPTPSPSTTRPNFGFVLPEIDLDPLEDANGGSFWALGSTTAEVQPHPHIAAAASGVLGDTDLTVGSPPPSLGLVLPCSPLDAMNTFSEASFFADFARVDLDLLAVGQSVADAQFRQQARRDSGLWTSLDQARAHDEQLPTSFSSFYEVGLADSRTVGYQGHVNDGRVDNIMSAAATTVAGEDEQPHSSLPYPPPLGLDIPVFTSPIELSTSFLPECDATLDQDQDQDASSEEDDEEEEFVQRQFVFDNPEAHLVQLSLASTSTSIASPWPLVPTNTGVSLDLLALPRSSSARRITNIDTFQPSATTYLSTTTSYTHYPAPSPNHAHELVLSVPSGSIDELDTVSKEISGMSEDLSDSVLGGLGELFIVPSSSLIEPPTQTRQSAHSTATSTSPISEADLSNEIPAFAGSTSSSTTTTSSLAIASHNLAGKTPPRSESTFDALAQLVAVSKELDAMEHPLDADDDFQVGVGISGLSMSTDGNMTLHQSFYASLGIPSDSFDTLNPLDRVLTPPPREVDYSYRDGFEFEGDEECMIEEEGEDRIFVGMRVRMQSHTRSTMFNGVEVPSIVVTRPEDDLPRYVPASSSSAYSCRGTATSTYGAYPHEHTRASPSTSTWMPESSSTSSSILGLTRQASLPNIEMLAVPMTDARGRVPRPRPASVPSLAPNSSHHHQLASSESTSSSSSSTSTGSEHWWTVTTESDGLEGLGYASLDLDKAVKVDEVYPFFMRDGVVMCACEACGGAVARHPSVRPGSACEADIGDDENAWNSGGEGGEEAGVVVAAPVTRGTDVGFGITIDGTGLTGVAALEPRPQSQARWLDSIDDERTGSSTLTSAPSIPATSDSISADIVTTSNLIDTTPFSPTHPYSSPSPKTGAFRFSLPLSIPIRASSPQSQSPTPTFKSFKASKFDASGSELSAGVEGEVDVVGVVERPGSPLLRRIFPPPGLSGSRAQARARSPTLTSPTLPPLPVDESRGPDTAVEGGEEGRRKTVKHKQSFIRRMLAKSHTPPPLPNSDLLDATSSKSHPTAPLIHGHPNDAGPSSSSAKAEVKNPTTTNTLPKSKPKGLRKKRSFLAFMKDLTFPKGGSCVLDDATSSTQASAPLPPQPPSKRAENGTRNVNTVGSRSGSSTSRKKGGSRIGKEMIGSPRPLSASVAWTSSSTSPHANYLNSNANAADPWNNYHAAFGPSPVGANPTIPRQRVSTAPGGGGLATMRRTDSSRPTARTGSQRVSRGPGEMTVAGGVDRSGSKASRASHRKPVSREFSGSMGSRGGARNSLVVDARFEPTRTRAMPLMVREPGEDEDEVLDVRPIYAI